MSDNKIRVTESPVYQAAAESIAYEFEWAELGTPASAGTTTLTRERDGLALASNLSGAAFLVGTKVTTPAVVNLLPNEHYILENKVTVGGKTLCLQCELIGV